MEHNRADDYTIGKLVAELQAHREEYKADREASKVWRSNVELEIKEIKAFISKVSPALSAIGVIVVAVLGGVGLWITHWIENHFR